MPPRTDITGAPTFRPITTNPDPKKVDTGGQFSAIGDSYRMGWMGQVGLAIERDAAGYSPATPDFDYRQHIPHGYESFAPFFAGADNQQEIDLRRLQVDGNIAARDRRDARGGWSTLGTDAVTGILDPINLIAPEVKGLGFVKGAIKGAQTMGVAGAASEGVRGSLDPTSSRAETVMSMLSSTALGGVIGGVAGKLGSRTVTPTINDIARPRGVQPVGPGLMPAVEQITASTESHFNRNAVSPKGAKSEMQVMDKTNLDPGYGVAPAKDGSLEERARVGRDYIRALAGHYNYDMKKAWAAYNWGPGNLDQAVEKWGAEWLAHAPEETKAYVTKNMSKLGEGDGAGVMAGAADPRAAALIVAGMDRPSHVEVDGRWVPVVDAPMTDRIAKLVPAKTPEEIMGEVAHESAAAESRSDIPLGQGAPPASIFDGLGKLKTNEIPDVAKAWARRAADEPEFAQQLGTRDLQEIDGIIRDERMKQMKEDMQRRADAGELAPKPEHVGPDAEPPIDRRLLARSVDGLQARLDRINSKLTSGVTGRALNELTNTAAALERKIAGMTNELEALGGRPDDIMHGELHLGSQLASEGDLHALGNVPVHEDEELANLRVDEAAKRARDTDSGELVDELPFAMDDGGAHYYHGDGEHIRIDSDAILKSFAERPWTVAKDGVFPFPEDAFRSPREWLDFVLAHEVEHSVNEKGATESLADYENRINVRAYERVQAMHGPQGIAGSRLRKLALVGTPIARLEKLVRDKGAKIHSAFQLLASDTTFQLSASRLGYTPLTGGSVFQRVERWRVTPVAELQQSLRKHYLEDLGISGEGTRAQVETRAFLQGARNHLDKAWQGAGAEQRKTFADFKEEVTAAYVGFRGEMNGKTFAEPSPAVAAAAADLHRLDQQFEAGAREVNLFGKTKDLQRQLDAADHAAKAMRERAANWAGKPQAKDFEDLAADAEKRAEELRARLSEPVTQPGEKQHYHRQYDVQAIKDNQADVLQRLEEAYRRRGLQDPSFAKAHPDPIASAAAAYDHLTLDPDFEKGEVMGPGIAKGAKQLTIPWTHAEAFPYILRDPEAAFGLYARQMGSAIEMTRSFGDPFALDVTDDLRADLIERGVPTTKANEAVQLFLDARDHITGGYHRRDPMAWDYRATRALKMIGNLATLGKAVYTQVSDLARFIGVQGTGLQRLVTGEGPAGLIGGLLSSFAGDISRFHPGGIAKISGEAGELVTQRLASLMMDSDVAVYAMKDSGLERALARAQVPFFMANLMTPWTVFWKELAGLTSAHSLIDEARQVAGHIQGTKLLGEKKLGTLTERLAQRGIDSQMAQLIASMPTETGAGGLHLPNVMAWEGDRGRQARDALLAAVNGEVRMSIPTPGIMERPRWFDGTFYSGKGHQEQLDKIDGLRDALNSATNPEDKAKLSGELEKARRDLGREGRWQQPLLALPFQMHAFAMSAGAKTLYGLFSASERNKIGGFLSLFLAGATVAYLKALDPIGSLTAGSDKIKKNATSWDRTTWKQYAWSTFEYSNLGAIFTDVAKNVTTLARLDGHDPSLGLVPNVDPQDHSARDEVGATLGLAPSLVYGLVEPFVTNDPKNSEADAIRRIIPFNNVIWWNGAVNRITDAVHKDGAAYGGGSQSPGFGVAPNIGRVGGFLGQQQEGGAFFAPDPESLKPASEHAHMVDQALMQPASFDLSNPPPLRHEHEGGRARVLRSLRFGDTEQAVAEARASGGVAPAAPSDGLPPLRRGRSPRRVRAVRASRFS